MHEMAQKIMNTSLFSFQDLKLSTREIIAILNDTLNITSCPLPIPNPHATWVPSNTLDKHSIGSCVANGTRNLVTNFNMVKLVGSPTFGSTFTYQKGTKNTSLVDLLFCKGIMDIHYFRKVFHSFPKVVPNEKTSIAIEVAIVDNTESVIHARGHTPKGLLLDIGAQPMILRVQFAKENGHVRLQTMKIYVANLHH
jgi:hypothetical protein